MNASVPAGSATAVVGPNGAGKTTLLRALLGQIPYTGNIEISPVAGVVPRIGYVPQRLNFDRGMPLNVEEFLVMGLQRMPLWLGRLKKHVVEAHLLLKQVRGRHLATRNMGDLSGGELQRVLLALALQQNLPY